MNTEINIFTVTCLILGILCGVLLHSIGENTVRIEAVKMGHGKYVLDNSGKVSFEWLATQTAELEEK